MQYAILRKILAVLIGFGLAATALWATGAEEEPAAAADKQYVTDPTTGKMVTAPEYGGRLTYPHNRASEIVDPFFVGPEAGWLISGVNETLAWGDWALAREEVAFKSNYVPLPAFTAGLMESWSQPDRVTYVFHSPPGRSLRS